MEIRFGYTGEQRKELVKTIGEFTGQPPVYQNAPTFAYRIGEYKVDKRGTLTGPNDQALRKWLKDSGFEAEYQIALQCWRASLSRPFGPLHLWPFRGILCVLREVFVVILRARLLPSLALSLVRICGLLQRIGNRMCFSMSAHVILQGFLLITLPTCKDLERHPEDFGTKRSQVQILSPRPQSS